MADKSVPDVFDEALEISNQIALLMSEAGIEPSGQSTGGLLLLAAGTSVHARVPPLSEERFMAFARAAYRMALKSQHVYIPTNYGKDPS